MIVSDLSSLFSVTEETIRRDLKFLEEEGVLIRTYGGAYIQDGVENEISHKLRETIYVDSKQAIAAKSKSIISNGDSIFLDCSTTCLFIAMAVQEMRLTIATNSLKITNVLSERENIRLITIGGRFAKQNDGFFGLPAVKTLSQFTFDKAFISCRSLSIQNGVNDSMEDLAQLRQSVLRHANQVVLVADYSKFNKSSFINICALKDINCLITDRPLSDEWHSTLSNYGVKHYD